MSSGLYDDLYVYKIKSAVSYWLTADLSLFIAEREGFEPPEVLPSTVFKTAAIDHSAISPWIADAKLRINFHLCKFFWKDSIAFS